MWFLILNPSEVIYMFSLSYENWLKSIDFISRIQKKIRLRRANIQKSLAPPHLLNFAICHLNGFLIRIRGQMYSRPDNVAGGGASPTAGASAGSVCILAFRRHTPSVCVSHSHVQHATGATGAGLMRLRLMHAMRPSNQQQVAASATSIHGHHQPRQST